MFEPGTGKPDQSDKSPNREIYDQICQSIFNIHIRQESPNGLVHAMFLWVSENSQIEKNNDFQWEKNKNNLEKQ